MKIKRLIALGLCSACLVAALAGCGRKDDAVFDHISPNATTTEISVDNGAASIEAIHNANTPLTLLGQYKTVEINTIFDDDSGTEVSTANLQYTKTEEGYLQSATHLKYNPIGGNDGADYYTNTYQAENIPGATYTVSEDKTYMVIYPASEYEKRILKEFLYWPTETVDTVESVSNNGGALSVVVKSVRPDLPDYYSVTTYEVDPTTLVINGMEVTTYTKSEEEGADDLLTSRLYYSYTYGEDYTPDGDTTVGALGGNDEKCDLTIIINPGENSEEVQNFKVNHGTIVSFDSEHTYKVFDNKEMKNPMENVSFDTTGKSATYYVKLDEA